MAKKQFSEALSLAGWDAIEFIKGRKKSVISLLGAGLMYLISDSELAALIAGFAFEGIIAVAEFYLKKVEL